MKISRSSGSFESRSRRQTRLPIVPIILVLLVLAVLAIAWSRGGEQPQKPVEKAIPAEKLGK